MISFQQATREISLTRQRIASLPMLFLPIYTDKVIETHISLKTNETDVVRLPYETDISIENNELKAKGRTSDPRKFNHLSEILASTQSPSHTAKKTFGVDGGADQSEVIGRRLSRRSKDGKTNSNLNNEVSTVEQKFDSQPATILNTVEVEIPPPPSDAPRASTPLETHDVSSTTMSFSAFDNAADKTSSITNSPAHYEGKIFA